MNVLKSQQHQSKERDVISFLEVFDIDSGERKILKTFDHLIEAPNWKNNNKELVYNANGQIYNYEIETGISKLVESGICNQCNNDHVLLPDNKRIAVSHHTYEDGQSRIYTFPLAGGIPTLITPIAPSYLHGCSPDGQSLSYCAERNGEYDIYVISSKGGIEKQLTQAPGLNDGPEYAPCGQFIWFNSVRSGLMQVWRMKADGSEQVQMTHDASNSWFPHLSPDGNTVAYITYKKGDVDPGDHPANKNVEIRLMSSLGGTYQTIIELFGGQGTLNVNSWSPDGKQLAFVSYKQK